MLGHLLRYDSTHGKLHQEIEISDGEISVDGNTFRVLAERDPSALPWKDMEVDVVVESTGLFTNREGASQHLTAGADKVVISAPATRTPDLTIVLGVNDDAYDAEKHHDHLQCVLHNQLGRPDGEDPSTTRSGSRSGLMTTIHAYTTEQQLPDQVAMTRKGSPICAACARPRPTSSPPRLARPRRSARSFPS